MFDVITYSADGTESKKIVRAHHNENRGPASLLFPPEEQSSRPSSSEFRAKGATQVLRTFFTASGLELEAFRRIEMNERSLFCWGHYCSELTAYRGCTASTTNTTAISDVYIVAMVLTAIRPMISDEVVFEYVCMYVCASLHQRSPLVPTALTDNRNLHAIGLLIHFQSCTSREDRTETL